MIATFVSTIYFLVHVCADLEGDSTNQALVVFACCLPIDLVLGV